MRLPSKFTNKPLVMAIGLAAMTTGSSALSQSSNDFLLEEIVVTAQKRAQSLQEVPIAVSAFDEDFIRQAQINDIGDLAANTPGFGSNVEQPAFPELFIRGVGSTDFGIGADPSIGVYIDGVYMGRSGGAISQLQDVARVEVLKGPQGTLFGRNTIAGAISVVTHGADADVSNRIGAKVGRHDHREIYGAGSIELVEGELFLRLSGVDIKRDGWQDNVPTGDEGGERDRWSYRGTLTWMPTDDVRVNFNSDWSRASENPGYTEVAYDAFDLAGFGVFDSLAKDYEDEKAASEFDALTTRKARGSALTVEWDIDNDLSLTSITSYREYETSYFIDVDGTTFELLNTQANVESSETYSQEFRLNGKSESFDWFVGLSYFEEDAALDLVDSLHYQNAEALTQSSFAAGDGLICQGAPGCNVTVLPGFLPQQIRSSGENESVAVFGDVTWHATEALSLTAGIRYTRDKKEFNHGFNNNNQFLPYGIPSDGVDLGNGFTGASQDDSWSNISPRFVADYKLSEDVLLYASYTQGYKGGGFNTFPSGSFNDLASADEETVDSVELGAKTTWLDGRLQANMAAYFYKYEDLQVLKQTTGPIPSFVLGNEGEAEGEGVEAEIRFLATPDLTLTAVLSYMNTEFKEGDFEGHDLLRAPSFSGAVGVDYVVDMDELGEIRINANYAYTGENFLTANSLPNDLDKQESHGLLSSRVSWSLGGEREWELAMWGTNLTDEIVRVTTTESLGAAFGLLGTQRNEPRMYGVDLQYSF